MNNNSKKTFLLDDGVLFTNPRALFSFDEHTVYVTEDTVRRLSGSNSRGEAGANAREALRLIAEYTDSRQRKQTPGGGSIRVLPRTEYASEKSESSPAVIQAFRCLSKRGDPVTLVTNSSETKIFAAMSDIAAEPYTSDYAKDASEQYAGRRVINVSNDVLTELYLNGWCDNADYLCAELVENEYLLLRDEVNPSHTGLARYRDGKLLMVKTQCPYGVTPRKVGQTFAIDALMAPVSEISLVILKGPAGTAKTFLSLAAALQQTLVDEKYGRILVSRPNVKFDNDIGFLKGSEEEKIGPLIRPVMDNLEHLCRTSESIKKDGMMTNSYVHDLFSNQTIVAQAMAYMRGRSIANTFILLDEFQNSTPSQAFGIISRLGEGSKVVLAGDPEQIDTPELDSRGNGLSFASARMKGSPCCAQIVFEPEECVRSQLALEAIKRMSPKSALV